MADRVSVAIRCGSCGNDMRAEARFCDVCGTPVNPGPAEAEHKQVTVLFADVVGSMKLAAALGAERLQELMNELFNRSAGVVQRYRGTVDKFTGDGLMALFGAPAALEDHALRACIAALEIQSVAEDLAATVRLRDGVDLQLRLGLNSGDVIVGKIGAGPGRYTAVGRPVGIAQRMQAGARPGQVLCSLSTAGLVEDAARLGPVEEVDVKGGDAPVPARRLVAVESDRRVLGRNEGLMLGRDTELALLRGQLDANDGCLVGVVGAPGLGKSRLMSEFIAVAAERGVDVAIARCEAHTTTLAFRALSRLLRALFKVEGLGDADARERTLAQCAGVLTPDSADSRILLDAMGIADDNGPQLQDSVDGRRRRLVELMTQVVEKRAVRTVLILEDAHWIDEPSDDILSEFCGSLSVARALFLTTFRPEFRGGLRNKCTQMIALQPLTDSVAEQLVGQLLGTDLSTTVLAKRIANAAAGNPFFVEEIVRDLAEHGLLSGNRGNYSLNGDSAEIAVPATVHAVLSSRIDRLPAEAKSVLNAAAVIGTRFDAETLQALLPEGLTSRLGELVSAELIDQTEFVPRERYCFHHPLVRTVAYESQLSATRARAHRRLAIALEANNPAAADENAALIATHLEAAGQLVDAYHWHMRAAGWLRPRDLAAARAQWESARVIADRLPDDHDDVIAMRIAPRTMLTSTLLYVGAEADMDERYREFRELAKHADDLKAFAIGTAGWIWSLCVNSLRVREGAALASELEDIVGDIDCDAEAKGVVLNAVAHARFANCEFDAALKDIDAIEALASEVPAAELAPAKGLRGVIEMCLGDTEHGVPDLRTAIEQSRTLPPVNFAGILHYSCIVATLGLCQTDDLVADTRDAVRSAETFGDFFGIITAQFSYGTLLLRAKNGSRREAIEMLERAREGIQKHMVNETFALAIIGADLAVEAARHGQRDWAIGQLRELFALHMDNGSRILAGCPGEALIALLIERGSTNDFTEAHRMLDHWRSRSPGIPALDLWWLKSRTLLANAEGDRAGHIELAEQYLELCERLNAEGRLDEARRLVRQIR